MLLLHLFDFPVIFLIIQLLLMATACLPIKPLNVYVNLESSRRRTDRILKMCPWTFAFLSVYFTPSSFSFFLSIFSLSVLFIVFFIHFSFSSCSLFLSSFLFSLCVYYCSFHLTVACTVWTCIHYIFFSFLVKSVWLTFNLTNIIK